MGWVKVDDQFADHPKFEDLSNDAVALWIRALAYCNRHMTDGAIKAGAAFRMAKTRRAEDVANELVAARLWIRVDGGFQVHDFMTWSTPRDERQRKAEEAKARKNAWKERQRNASQNTNGTQTERVPTASPERGGDAQSEDRVRSQKDPPAVPQGGPLELVPSEPGPAADVAAVWAAYADAARRAGRKPPKVTSERSAKVRARIAELGVETVIAAVRGVWLDPWAKPGGTCGSAAGTVDPEHVLRNVLNAEKYAATWEASQRHKPAQTAVQREAGQSLADDIIRERRAALGLAPTQNGPAVAQNGPATASGSDLGAV